ncbi:ATP-binding cassette domain-containing protein, partial [Dialister sp.]|uniref:ATP-binding cassette domain-containing protein n=1 Tax=Dialister sp. TaxID=1955814 RepID=UPI003F06F86A
MPIIKVEHLYKNFGSLEVLKDCNLEVNEGEVVCIIGPSGGGKSTFLRSLNHLETITSGKIWIDGKLIDDRAHEH